MENKINGCDANGYDKMYPDGGPYKVMVEKINFLYSRYHIVYGDTLENSVMCLPMSDAIMAAHYMNMAHRDGYQEAKTKMESFMDENRPIIQSIEKAMRKVKERKWDKTYWLIDIHETILKPDWKKGGTTEFYPFAIDVLKILSSRKDVCLILWTSSWPDEIERYLKMFASCGIDFDYINRNPEVVSEAYGYYEDKPYANIICDDKAGFSPEIDLPLIHKYLKENEKQTI